MKKAMLKVMGLVLAIIVAISTVGAVVAQENFEVVDIEPLMRVLSVEVEPGVGHVGEPVVVTVTEKNTGTLVDGVYVYARNWHNTPTTLTSSTESSIWPVSSNWEFLGQTEDGKMEYTFTEAGHRLIVVTKDGYCPGMTRYNVKPQTMRKLKIRAPWQAEVEELVSMQVLEKGTNEGIPGADVWAIHIPNLISDDTGMTNDVDVKAILEELRNSAEDGVMDIINRCGGWHIGQTGDDGMIEYQFPNTGRYLLVTAKAEYMPGIKWISIVPDNAMVIKSPMWAGLDEDVTFTVKTKGSGTLIEGVDLYGINLNDATDSSIRSGNLKDMESKAYELAEMATDNGFYIGTTNGDGQYAYQFDEEGRYLVIGIEEGYIPAVTYITIGQFGILRERIGSFENLLPEDGDVEGTTPGIKRFRQGWGNIFPQIGGLKRMQPQAGSAEGLLPGIEVLPDASGEMFFD